MGNPRHGVQLNHINKISLKHDPLKWARGIGTASVLLVALCASVFVSGCVDDDKSFVIMAVIPPDTPPDCTLAIQGGNNFNYQSSGLLDLDFNSSAGFPNIPPSYGAYLQLHNYFLNSADKDMGRLDSNRVTLERFEVTYSWEVGAEIITQPGNENLAFLEDSPPVIIPTGGFVDSASAVDKPGKALIGVGLIPPDQGAVLLDIQTGDELSVVLGVHVKAFGHTVGGKAVESNTFVYPIYFCRSCHACPANFAYIACMPGQDNFTCEDNSSD